MLLDISGNLCTDIQILNILVIFKTILKIATIVVPVILTIMIMVDIIKTVSSQDVETKKLYNTIIKRAMAAVIIFLVPYIIKLALGLIPMGNYKYVDCYNNAEKQKVAQIAIDNANQSLNELKLIVSTGFNPNDKASKNKAEVAYEKARKDIKLIPNNVIASEGDYCLSKKECKEQLEQLGKKFK